LFGIFIYKMKKNKTLRFKLWGVRGNSAPAVNASLFGIHTTSVTVRSSSARAVFVDMGSGIIAAAENALQGGCREFDIFFTHLHSDHLNGLVSFLPFYRKDCTIRIYAVCDAKSAMQTLFNPPFHPVCFSEIAAKVEFIHLEVSGSMQLLATNLQISWEPVNHPQGCTAYRFDNGHNALVFATDVELYDNDNQLLQQLLSKPYPAGIAIMDATYSMTDIKKFRGWGHSSPEECIKICKENRVNKLILTHHNSYYTDNDILLLEKNTPNFVSFARERFSWVMRENQALMEQNQGEILDLWE